MNPLFFFLGLVVFAVYVLTAGPTFYWIDSSEFVASAWGLGNAHPPGHPLAALIGRVICYLPVGNLAFRVTLASALETAGATVLVAMISRQLLDRVSKVQDEIGRPKAPSWIYKIAVATSALVVGFSYSVWFQAVRAEVYALNLFLILLAVYFLLQWDIKEDKRKLFIAAFVIGLALCNHHFLVLLALPSGIAFVFVRKNKPGFKKIVVGTFLAGTLGLSTLIYLPLRAQQSPQVNWGSPSTFERFTWVVSARAFQKAVKQAENQTTTHRAIGALFAVMGGLGPIAALFALAGLYLLWRGNETQRVAMLLTGLVLFNLAGPFLIGFDPFNPDAHGYLSVSVAALGPALSVLIVVAVRALTGHLRRVAAIVGTMAIVLCAYQAIGQWEKCDLSDHWAAEETTHHILDQPHGSLLITSYFSTIFNIWAVSSISDLRPDVEVLHRNFLSQPGYVEDLKKRWPTMFSFADRWRANGKILTEDLNQLSRDRPIFVEYDLNISTSLASNLFPVGLVMKYGDFLSDFSFSAHKTLIEQWSDAVGPLNELETRRALVWKHYLLTHFACRGGFRDLARFHFEQAKSLAPQAISLQQLTTGRCKKTLGF